MIQSDLRSRNSRQDELWTSNWGKISVALLNGSVNLRLPRDDSDAVFTALKLLVSDERPDVNRNFHTTIFPCFHSKRRQQWWREKQRKVPDLERERESQWSGMYIVDVNDQFCRETVLIVWELWGRFQTGKWYGNYRSKKEISCICMGLSDNIVRERK